MTAQATITNWHTTPGGNYIECAAGPTCPEPHTDPYAGPNRPAPSPETIADRAMLVDLTISQWSNSRQDKAASRETTDRHGAQADMGRFSKNLIDPKAIQSIRRAAAAAAQEHRDRTLPWMNNGTRILPAAGFAAYAAAMRKHEATFESAVQAFIWNYPSEQGRAQYSLGSLYDATQYPTPDAMRAAHAIGYNVVPIPTAADFRVDIGELEMARIRHQITNAAEAATAAAMTEVATRIKDVVSHMSERLAAYHPAATKTEGVFRDTLVTNVRELCDLLDNGLNLTNDPAIAEIARAMRADLTQYSPDKLRASADARNRTKASADAILAQMSAII